MIILENPYVSDFLIETIKKNNFSVLDNEISRKYLDEKYLVNSKNAIKKYETQNELFYTNSENSIDWIFENLPNTKLAKMIELSKNKAQFRKELAAIYPDYYFKEINICDLSKIKIESLKFPLILKPSVGFLSFGVYSIKNENEWNITLEKLNNDLKKVQGIFPKSVVNTSNFLIEEMIEGEEFALDAYFDNEGKATIFNIFQHPFFNEKDVSDRLYFTSKQILEKYLDKFQVLLDEIGEKLNYKNFPFHLELRASKNKIIPIELNPMRFCGWCITDIANYAWGINVYEYFLNQKKPDWDEILKNSDNDYFYFTIGDIPSSIDKTKIRKVDYEKYLSNIKNPLAIRKIDYKTKPVFSIVFAKTPSIEEMKNLLALDMNEFIVQ